MSGTIADPRADESAALEVMRAGFAAASERQTPLERRVRIAGLALHLRVAGDALAARLLPALSHHPQPEGGEPRLTAHLWDAAETGTPLPGFPESAMDGGITGEARTAAVGDVRLRYQPDLRVLTGYDRRDATAWYCAAHAADLPWWEDGAPLRTLFAWWLPDHGRILTHGAAVGSSRGAALLVGRGGSGKSSTALACLLGGMGYLGDDYCVVEPAPSPQVHSLYATAKVHADQLGFLGPLADHQLNPHRRPDDKALLLVSASDARLVHHAPVTVVLVPTVADREDTVIEPISRAGALSALAPSTIFQLPGAGSDELASMAALVRTVPCRRLLLGRDRAAIPPVVDGLLDDLTGVAT